MKTPPDISASSNFQARLAENQASRAKGMSGKNISCNSLAIVGASPGCGKTTFTSGLAALLVDQGIELRASKPISIGDSEKAGYERMFISTLAGSKLDYPQQTLDFPPAISFEILEFLKNEKKEKTLSLVEFPGAVATPLLIEPAENHSSLLDASQKMEETLDPTTMLSLDLLSREWLSTADLAARLEYPVILVAEHGPDVFERLDLSYEYLKARNIEILAIATVDANLRSARFLDHYCQQSDFEMLVRRRYPAPYLGRLLHSSSISVTIVCHGNLRSLAAECLDLVLLRELLGLSI